jgi:hypothetical protein
MTLNLTDDHPKGRAVGVLLLVDVASMPQGHDDND